MELHSIASAVPPVSYSQAEVLAELRGSGAWGRLRARSRTLLERILEGESGIRKRHFCHSSAEALLGSGPQQLSEAFEASAPELAGAALTRALERGGVAADQVDALFVCTCTGYLCPGLSSHVAERAGMRPDAVLQDLVGLGCGAAIPTLRAASHFLRAEPGATAAVVAVEVCSAAFFLDDDPGVLISLCLFGDGASASLWRSPGRGAAGWQAEGFRSLHRPDQRERIRFVNDGGRLKNQLHRSVPGLAASAVADLFQQEGFNGTSLAQHVVSHGGGRDVIQALREALPGHPLIETEQVLAEFGNMSSPSVLFALERALDCRPGGSLWLSGFGAGFSAHSCRLSRREPGPA